MYSIKKIELSIDNLPELMEKVKPELDKEFGKAGQYSRSRHFDINLNEELAIIFGLWVRIYEDDLEHPDCNIIDLWFYLNVEPCDLSQSKVVEAEIWEAIENHVKNLLWQKAEDKTHYHL